MDEEKERPQNYSKAEYGAQQKEIQEKLGSAGQKRVPVHFLETYKIPLPPIAEQKRIVKHLDSLSQKLQLLS